MTHKLMAVMLISFAFCFPVLAKTPKGGGSAQKSSAKETTAQQFTLLQANAVSVTVSTGGSNKSFKIKGSTEVKINGLPAPARDLKGGMVAEITLDTDNVTALSINANDPKKPAPTATPELKKGKKSSKK